MSDFVHSGALLPLIPPAPFSHKGRRGSLGVLMPETRDGTQRLSKKSPPVRHAPCLSRFPRKRGNREGWEASRRPRCTRREAGVSAADYAIGNGFSRRRALCGTGAYRDRTARLLGNVAASLSPFVLPDIEADIRPGSWASSRRARWRSPGGRSGQHFFVKRTRIGANFAQISSVAICSIRGNPWFLFEQRADWQRLGTTKVPTRGCLPRIPRCQHQPPGAVLAVLPQFLLLQHAKRLAGEVGSFHLVRVKDVA